MDSVAFDFPRLREIEINGVAFKVLMSEDEILDKLVQFATASKKTKSLEEPESVPEQSSPVNKKKKSLKDSESKLAEFLGFCDQMLGEGAFQSLIVGHPMSIDDKAVFVMKIAQTACTAYRKKLAEYDE